ncbi:PAS domain S-box protein [Marinibaculum pumilum]|uniref:histidine kinase n=1 Tax=Marinibaculum pumilum TaxID=1766165 RepID=A0ABV7LA59_9PROT
MQADSQKPEKLTAHLASAGREPFRRSVALRSVLLFLPQAVIGGAILYLLFDLQADGVLSVVRANQESTVAEVAQRTLAELSEADADLLYLASRPALRHWLETRDPAGRAALEADLRVFAAARAGYEQIRLLDATGQETLRIDWHAGAPAVVPPAGLRDRSGRPYVQEMLTHAPGTIHVSPFDLNVEDGEIEPGPKPVVRFGTALADDRGELLGMIVLNLMGSRLLDGVAAMAGPGPGAVWMLNSDGYWLRGPSPDVEWGFLYPARSEQRFGRRFPRAWSAIQADPAGGQLRTEAGLFTYVTIRPEGDLPADGVAATLRAELPAWILVGFLPAHALEAQRDEQAMEFVPAAAALALLSATLSFGIARASVQRQQADQRMRSSELRFRALLESAPDAVVITDPSGRIVLVNAQTERLFGHAREQLVGQDVEILVPVALRSRHVGHRRAYLEAPRVREMGAGQDLNGLRADGTTFPVSISLSPVQTDDGLLVVADIRDVGDRLQAERQIQDLNQRLRRDNAELEAVNRELEAFSYSVSHDLRAPLRAIDGFSQALVEDYGEQLDDEGRHYLSRVRQGAQRMGRLIDDLLKLSRVTRQELAIADVDLAVLAQEVVDRLRSEAPDREVEVAIDGPLFARGDQRLLQIALDNLLGNAWKFTSGQDRAWIRFDLRDAGGEPAFCIADNGAGFDMVYADQLFRAFQRLHTPSEFPGTGIGLATVQRIIHKHGGRIWAESEAGRGARFFFTLQRPPAAGA